MAYGLYTAESRRTRAVRWTGAAMVVIAVHIGVALALLRPREDDDTDFAGAIAIELTPIAAAPALTSADIAPGPLMQEEAPASEARKQTRETVAEKAPPLEPAPLAPEPAVQLPEPQPDEKHETRQKMGEKVAREEIQTAPPPSETKPSDIAAAPMPGLSAMAAKAQATWQKSLVTHINRYKRYPAEARAQKMTGIVIVEFTLDQHGQVLSPRVAHSSGAAVLDEEAIALLRRAAPLPTPPQDVPTAGIPFAIPIHFRMN